MPGPLTYTAIALLARDRLRQIRDLLTARTPDHDLERYVRFLAKKAHGFTTAGGATIEPPIRLGPPLTDQVSRAFLAGGIGPDIPGYAALFAPGQQWLRDTMHKGTPDEHREKVLAGSTAFVFHFWRIAKADVESELKDDERADALAAMRAYVLGHCCHIAADVICSPYLDAVTARLGTDERPFLDRAAAISILEAEVATTFFGRSKTRSGDFGDWWPSRSHLPSTFFKSYLEALEATYGGGARREGFAEYEERRATQKPPELSEKLLKDGYSTFRTVVQTGAAWDYWDWVGVTAPLFVPFSLLLPFAALLPKGKDFFRDVAERPDGYDTDAGLFEVLTFPFAATALAPLVVSIIVASSYLGATPSLIYGFVVNGVQIVAAAVFFSTLGSGGGAKWGLLFGLPLVLELIHFVVVAASSHGGNMHNLLGVSSLMHLLMGWVFLGCYAGFLHLGVEDWDDPEGKNELFWGLSAAWLGITVVLWFAVAIPILRYAVGGRLPRDERDVANAERNRHVRLFDDTTLATETPGSSPKLGELNYPSGRRQLLKLWWEGGGPPKLTIRRDRLTFDFGGGQAPEFVAPVALTTLGEMAASMERSIRNATGDALLKVRFAFPADPDLLVVPGLLFSDNGDGETDQAKHDAGAAKIIDVPTTEDTALVLFHAPKVVNSVRYAVSGPTVDDEDRRVPLAGAAMGVVSSVAGSRTITAGAGAPPFRRVFRSGDVVRVDTAPAAQTRIVVSVDSDTQLTVSRPLDPPAAGDALARPAANRAVEFTPPPPPAPPWTVSWDADKKLLTGAGGDFATQFMPGDIIAITIPNPLDDKKKKTIQVERMVVQVDSATEMRISQPIDATNAPFVRRASQSIELHTFLASPDDNLQSADSLMNHAADLAALLCLGATSHVLDDRNVPDTAAPLNPVYQVFRNWNLDRRRENEWRMLVLGNAFSEKRGDFDLVDDAVPPATAADYRVLTPAGEPVANRLGWLPLLRSWMDVAGRRAQPGPSRDDIAAPVAFRPGNPANIDLSRGLAFLLDLPAPDPSPFPDPIAAP